MNKKVLILLIIIVLMAAVGGFFYLQTLKNDEETARPGPPKLFSKGDYKVEERPDGKYIMVDKVGLTAKVPDGWRVEFEGNDMPDGTSQYWVDLYSSDIATTTGNVLKTGCIISITAQNAERTYQDLTKNIKIISQGNPEEVYSLLKQDYVLAEDFRLVNIGNHDGLEIISQENAMLGGGRSINIPFKDHLFISIGLGFPLKYKEKCSTIWEEFLKTVELK